MTSTPVDFAPLYAPDLPQPAPKWTGFPKYNFIGGHNDAAVLPVDALVTAATNVLQREGASLSTYGLNSGPLGYRPLREFLTRKLKGHADITCSPDEIMLTSGSLQGLDLVNALLLARGDTVIVEQDTYGGTLSRLTRLGAKVIGIPLDEGGLRLDVLEAALKNLKEKGVRAKFVYTIPTVQNPTGSIMSLERRRELLALSQAYGVPIFEDECYSDLIWNGTRPPALYALAGGRGVIHIGSFSKSVAPALRVGYIVAPWDVLSRIQALKTDAGSGALEQMLLAEFCNEHFSSHVPKLNAALRAKLETLMEALAEQFGTAAEFVDPPGGIYLWVKLPDNVDALRLFQVAQAAGIAINPGPEWSTDKAHARSRLRLCFAYPSHEAIREGVAALADVCAKEFGVPVRSGNVKRG
jgi:2-aminoadipate transaminase